MYGNNPGITIQLWYEWQQPETINVINPFVAASHFPRTENVNSIIVLNQIKLFLRTRFSYLFEGLFCVEAAENTGGWWGLVDTGGWWGLVDTGGLAANRWESGKVAFKSPLNWVPPAFKSPLNWVPPAFKSLPSWETPAFKSPPNWDTARFIGL